MMVSDFCGISESDTSDTSEVETVIWLSEAVSMRQSPLKLFFDGFCDPLLK